MKINNFFVHCIEQEKFEYIKLDTANPRTDNNMTKDKQ